MTEKQPGPTYQNTLILAAILLLAMVLRLNGLDWGMPNPIHPNYSYHPDEVYLLSWAEMLQHDAIIPKHFIYGGTFYYSILQLYNGLGSLLAEQLGGPPLFSIILVGRTCGVLYALLTIHLVYTTGRLLFSPRAGLLAALALAVFPAHVFHAQVVRPDEFFALEYAAQIYLLARILKKQGTMTANLAIGGLLLGVAVATRFPAGILTLGYAMAIYLILSKEFQPDKILARRTALGYLAILAGTGTLGYLGASPSTVMHFPDFLAGLQVQWQYQSGVFLDAAERGPNWYQYGGRILSEALGHPFQGLIFAAVGYALWKRRAVDLLLLSVLLPYFLLLAKTSWVVTRYTLPLLPPLALLLASLLRDLAGKKPFLKTLTAGVVVLATLWSTALDLAFAKTLRGPDPRDTASRWLAEEAGPGANIGAFDCYAGDYFTNPPKYWQQKWYQFHLNREGIAEFLTQPFDYLVVNEAILADTKRLGTSYPGLLPYNRLLAWTRNPPGYSLVKSFTTEVSFAGLNLGARFSSVDSLLARPAILIYRRDPSK